MDIHQNEKEIAVFNFRINDLVTGKLIMVDKNISNLLKFIALSPQLSQCVSETLLGVSYAAEFERARTYVTQADGKVRPRLVLPQDCNRLVTFVICLLAELDSQQRNILDFLQEYFYDKDSQSSYDKFCDAILRPFRSAGELVLAGDYDISIDVVQQKTAEKYFDAEQVYISSQAFPHIIDELQILSDKVRREFNAGKALKNDMLQMCEALYNAIVCRNPKLVNLFWIGLFYTFKVARFADGNISRLEALLYKNNLIS